MLVHRETVWGAYIHIDSEKKGKKVASCKRKRERKGGV